MTLGILGIIYHENLQALNTTNIYLFKVNNKSFRKKCEICSSLTIKTPERRRSGVFIVNLEHISLFLLLTLNIFHTIFYCFYC